MCSGIANDSTEHEVATEELGRNSLYGRYGNHSTGSSSREDGLWYWIKYQNNGIKCCDRRTLNRAR